MLFRSQIPAGHSCDARALGPNLGTVGNGDSAEDQTFKLVCFCASDFSLDSKTGDADKFAIVGLIFSAFGWTYAAMQIPGGWLVDRVPPRILYTAALLLWSIATVMLGFAASFIALFVLRMAVGALEAPAYPINSRVVTTWFPERERATAIGFYTSGQFVGLAFLTPVLAWLQHAFGWHMVFVVTGGVGILWAAIWYAVYREPKDFKGANTAEIELIREGGGLVDMQEKAAKAPFSWVDLGIVLSKRKLWGIYLGQFCLNSTLWFFLTWFPTYLVKYRGMDFIKSGLLASLPFLAAFVGVGVLVVQSCHGIPHVVDHPARNVDAIVHEVLQLRHRTT